LEIEKCGVNIGKQDQYAAAYGGIMALTFKKDGMVKAERLQLDREMLVDLEENLMLFFTGEYRDAGKAIETAAASKTFLDYAKVIGLESRKVLEQHGDARHLGNLMHAYWIEKLKLIGATNGNIDRCYKIARANGAAGGKLVGAGGGGFLLFYAENKQQLRAAMAAEGLEELRFRFDYDGTKVVMS